MPETTKEYEVLAHFRVKDSGGKSVSYDPGGDFDEKTGLGWPGAKKTFRGDPNSDQVKELLAGAGGTSGPLIGEKSSSGGSTSAASGKEN